MGGFVSGLGFVIRIFALLFTWAAVAIFISPELAMVMGLLVIVLWAVVFLPKGLWDELSWQRKTTATLKAAREQAAPYQAGMALPAPMGGSSGSGTTLTDYDASSRSAEIDAYREMPKLEFAPRDHIGRFKRSLALPVVGLLMVFCANNDSLIRNMMATVGIEHELPIEWTKLTLSDEWLLKRNEMESAARLALTREPYCGRILDGQIEAIQPLTTAPREIRAEIEAGRYRYIFSCSASASAANPNHTLTIWVTPHDLQRSRLMAVAKLLSTPPPAESSIAACKRDARRVFAVMGVSLDDIPVEAPSYFKGSLPFPDRSRIVSIETLHREGRIVGQVEVNCYVGTDRPPETRFSRPEMIPPL